MFLLIGRWVLGGLLRVGLSEGAAGAFVGGWLFKPLVALVLGAGVWFGGTWAVRAAVDRHDARVAAAATSKCVAEHQLAAEQARSAALERAAQDLAKTLHARELNVNEQAQRLGLLEQQLQEARDASAKLGHDDAVAIQPGDPWLRPPRRK